MATAEIKVTPYYSNEAAVKHGIIGGYRLAMLYCDCRDSPYEWIKHPAVFKSKDRAENFLSKVMKGKITMCKWGNSIPAYGVI